MMASWSCNREPRVAPNAGEVFLHEEVLEKGDANQFGPLGLSSEASASSRNLTVRLTTPFCPPWKAFTKELLETPS